MKAATARGPATANLRQRAEQRLRAYAKTKGLSQPETDALRFIQELEVHQIELELQNEELTEVRHALEASLERYTALYDFAPVGYLSLDQGGCLREVNLTAAKLLGLERSRLMNRPLARILGEPARPVVAAFLRKIFAGEAAGDCEITLGVDERRPMRSLQISGCLSPDGQMCQMVMQDITDRRAAERESQQLAAIVDSSGDAIISATVEGAVTSWNKSAERILGFAAEEIIGRPIGTIIPPSHPGELSDMIEQIRQGHVVGPLETVRLKKSGDTFPAEVTISPVKDAAGKIIGASGIIRDITWRKDLDARLAEMAERERRQLGRELHDGLGQQLHALHFMAMLLVKGLRRDGSPRAGEADRLSTLIQQTTTLARGVARGLLPVNPTPEGLMTALRELAALTRNLYGLDCQFRCRRPVLIVDHLVATHLFRIAQEAVNNAVKHARPKQIKIVLSTGNGRLILGITDDGTGRRASRRKRQGVGLHIMHHRAHAIEGSLAIMRRPGEGTEVVCSMPFPPPPKCG